MGKMRGWCLGLVMSIVVILAVCDDEPSEDSSPMPNSSALLCCKVFISETCNRTALDVIEEAAKRNSETVIVSKIEDREYNRVRFTLVSNLNGDDENRWTPLNQTVQNMVEAAIGAIDLTLHKGSFPWRGVVDDILVHPLAGAKMEDAVWLVEKLANFIGQNTKVPVYLCDEAHPQNKDLCTIKKNPEYSKPNMTMYVPDKGNAEDYSPKRGITTIRACPWVDLYNIPISSANTSMVDKIAKGVRKKEKKQTGHRTVKTLGLVHGDDSEILCMLNEPKKIDTDRVQEWVEELAAKEGLAIKKGYCTDFSEERTIEIYNNFKPSEGDQSNTISEKLIISTEFQFASGVVRIKTLDPRIGRIILVLELLELERPKKEIHLTIMIPQWTRQEHFYSS